MRLLISWMSKASDFLEGSVNEKGPNLSFHQYFYEYDEHVLLCSEKQEDTAFEFLLNTLKRKYPSRTISGRYLGLNDVIDLEEVLPKIRSLILEYKDQQIDIFFSPGTSIMQLSWFILHTTLGLDTRLIQLREGRLSKDKKPEKLLLEVDQSMTPITATIRQISQNQKDKDFLVTDRLKPTFERASKVAQAGDVTVLISGETGTGKEVVATYIHKNSYRRSKPFVAINCSAFSDNLLESRLFGYRKGAFTDAKSDQKGLFHQADGGTIFLDEIGDISSYMQQALLRVLQEKEIHPIGGTAKDIDVQVITATNKDLVDLCDKGDYRWDLYYRLAVAEIGIPPLRERGEKEVEQMLNYLVEKKKREMRFNQTLTFEGAAWDKLIKYHYPGNVREMENVVESLYVFNEGKIKPVDLPERIQKASGTVFLLSEVERQHILNVTTIFNNQRMKAAEALGISYNTYKKKMKEIEKEV
ncbi:sigma 54-interacting transcriptional regulator [Catalinimonas sp. 4WD22]|uniref:sigma 54-interacting transcriptional regulator n=1 Tax=Catalinimonas locisalis TaxID=3133978 RepID=UPI00310104E2